MDPGLRRDDIEGAEMTSGRSDVGKRSMIHPVILSGGSGTRLWPMSRSLYPKQLLALTGERSLLQQTVLRVAGDAGFAPPLIIANEEHRFIIAEQLREIAVVPDALVLEPVGRNTAPAACVAALRLAASEPDALMLVMPSDHVIGDLAAFRTATGRAAAAARAGRLVSLGIRPERPETGYGYIAAGAPIDGVEGAFAVSRFVEKPDAARGARRRGARDSGRIRPNARRASTRRSSARHGCRGCARPSPCICARPRAASALQAAGRDRRAGGRRPPSAARRGRCRAHRSMSSPGARSANRGRHARRGW